MAAKQKFKDGQKVWLEAKVIRKTCVGYIVKANGGSVVGYVQATKMRAKR